jgi:hypothetical protein
MTKQVIRVPAILNDGAHRPVQEAVRRVNANFTELYGRTVSVKDYGAVGDGVTDDWAAIRAALDSGAGSLYFPAGTYYLTKCLNLKKTVTLFGESGFQSGSSPSILKYADTCVGIIVHRHNTNADDFGYNNVKLAVSTTAADGSVIRHLSIQRGTGADTTRDGITHGIRMRARAHVDHCYVSGFAGNGIHIYATSGGTDESEGNANNWGVSNTRIQNNNHGMFVDGTDVNAGLALHVDSSSNDEWGFYESSFLGNTYVACHANGNAAGHYFTDSNNAANLILNCYSESGYPVSQLVAPTIVIGGLHGAGLSGTYYSLQAVSIFGNFTSDLGNFVAATTGTGRYIKTWNQGSVNSARASTVTFQSGASGNSMMTGSVTARPTASNITNRSAIGLEIYDGTLLSYETAIEAVGSTNAINPGTTAQWSLGSSSLLFTDGYIATLRPGAGTAKWTSGAGTPEGAVTAVVGSLFTRTDGGGSTTLYIKESGSGNTGWAAK